MKITIDRLKEIIKEEIENDNKLSDFTSGASQTTKRETSKKVVDNAFQLLALELEKQKSLQKKAQSVGLILQKIGIAPDELKKIADILRTQD